MHFIVEKFILLNEKNVLCDIFGANFGIPHPQPRQASHSSHEKKTDTTSHLWKLFSVSSTVFVCGSIFFVKKTSIEEEHFHFLPKNFFVVTFFLLLFNSFFFYCAKNHFKFVRFSNNTTATAAIAEQFQTTRFFCIFSFSTLLFVLRIIDAKYSLHFFSLLSIVLWFFCHNFFRHIRLVINEYFFGAYNQPIASSLFLLYW